MCKTIITQPTILHSFGTHKISKKLSEISKLLDRDNSFYFKIADSMDIKETNFGRKGMTLESTIRCCILKQFLQSPYEYLAFQISDSESIRAFAKLPDGLEPKKSALQSNISMLSIEALVLINEIILKMAKDLKIENGKKVRVDTTAVATNVMTPSDSGLLYKSICKCVEMMEQTGGIYHNHTKVSKKLFTSIRNCRGKEKRARLYKELMKYASKTLFYMNNILSDKSLDVNLSISSSMEYYSEMLIRIISQTHRRVVLGETVPAADKVSSLFEDHTDIIRKGGRETVFGHKVNFATGVSGLVLAVDMPRGNPSDFDLLIPALKMVKDFYGYSPKQVAADGGYASQNNLDAAKDLGVKNVAFHKRRGLKVEEMCQSNWLYKKLLRFRAGIEGNISHLKRVFGVGRCNWSGWEGFQKYIMASVIAYNLKILAAQLTTQ